MFIVSLFSTVNPMMVQDVGVVTEVVDSEEETEVETEGVDLRDLIVARQTDSNVEVAVVEVVEIDLVLVEAGVIVAKRVVTVDSEILRAALMLEVATTATGNAQDLLRLDRDLLLVHLDQALVLRLEVVVVSDPLVDSHLRMAFEVVQVVVALVSGHLATDSIPDLRVLVLNFNPRRL